MLFRAVRVRVAELILLLRVPFTGSVPETAGVLVRGPDVALRKSRFLVELADVTEKTVPREQLYKEEDGADVASA